MKSTVLRYHLHVRPYVGLAGSGLGGRSRPPDWFF